MHLLVQLGNGHASIPIALVLANNRAYSGSASLNFAAANQFLEVPYCHLKASHFAGLFLSLVAGGRILDAAI
jgi:hypothetical protein